MYDFNTINGYLFETCPKQKKHKVKFLLLELMLQKVIVYLEKTIKNRSLKGIKYKNKKFLNKIKLNKI